MLNTEKGLKLLFYLALVCSFYRHVFSKCNQPQMLQMFELLYEYVWLMKLFYNNILYI